LVIDPKVLDDKEAEAEQKVRKAETLMYGGNIREEQGNITLKAEELSRQFNAEYGTTFSEEDFIKIAGWINEATQAAAENPNETLENAFKKSIGVKNSAYNFAEELLEEENRQMLLGLYSDIEKANDSIDYHTQEILKNSIENQYGTVFETMAKDNSEDGIDETKYDMLLNAAASLSKSSEFKSQILEIDVIDADRDNLGDYGNGKYGYIESNEDLVKAYVTDILQKGDELENYTYDYGNYINKDGKKLVDDNITFKEMA
jgi:hypothetical protein